MKNGGFITKPPFFYTGALCTVVLCECVETFVYIHALSTFASATALARVAQKPTRIRECGKQLYTVLLDVLLLRSFALYSFGVDPVFAWNALTKCETS